MAESYTIQSITETPVVAPGGDIIKMHRIRAVTASGQPFSVEIPESEFTDENVRKLVRERAELIDGLVG